jgi:hypothetical protein
MLHASNSSILHPSTSASAFKLGTSLGPNAKASSGPLALAEKIREPVALVLQAPEEQDDNWDDDFEEGISFTKLQGTHPPLFGWALLILISVVVAALEKTTMEEDKHEVEDPGKTIRPTKSPAGPGTVPLPPSSAPVEDWSDLATEEDEKKLEDKVAGFKVRFSIYYMNETCP